MDERERQYREYLALRQQNQNKEESQDSYRRKDDEKYGGYFAEDINRTRPEKRSVTGTPYGSSELRRKQKEKEQRDEEMREYLAAREADRNKRGVRSGVSTPRGAKQKKRSPEQHMQEYSSKKKNKKK